MINKMLRGGGWTLIALGCVILEFAVYELVGTSLVTGGHQRELRKEFHALADNPVVAPTAEPRRPPRNRRAIALLTIPNIDVNVIVVEGVRIADLAYGPGHYPATPDIGDEGSTGIAGHRTGWGSPFLNLDKLRPGDRITIETLDGTTYVYRVTGTAVVPPTNTRVLRGNPRSTAKRQLTLTTCTPKYTSRNRLIVWSDLVETKAAT